MKRLTLRCLACGARREFAGANAKEILAQIDAAEWRDMLTLPASKQLPRGQGFGLCPARDAIHEKVA